MNFNFGEVLTRAWQIVSKHKVLWIFGILAGCSQGGRVSSGSNGGGGNGTGPTNIPPQLERILEIISQNAVPFVILAVSLVCIFWLLALFLGAIGRIGLIRGTWQADAGRENLGFGQLFSESTPYFWRIFGLSLIVGLPVVLILGALAAALIVFGISLIDGTSNARAFGLLGVLPVTLLCVCLLVPIGFVITMIVRQAERAIVLEDMPVLASLSRGWDIFRNNLGVLIVMAILLVVIGMVAGFIIAIPFLLVVVPMLVAFALGNSQNFTPLIIAGALACLVVPLVILLNGILTSYLESVWTLTYLRLTRKPDSNDLTPDVVVPPSLDDGDRTVISRPNA